jgi:hypothetical protein
MRQRGSVSSSSSCSSCSSPQSASALVSRLDPFAKVSVQPSSSEKLQRDTILLLLFVVGVCGYCIYLLVYFLSLSDRTVIETAVRSSAIRSVSGAEVAVLPASVFYIKVWVAANVSHSLGSILSVNWDYSGTSCEDVLPPDQVKSPVHATSQFGPGTFRSVRVPMCFMGFRNTKAFPSFGNTEFFSDFTMLVTSDDVDHVECVFLPGSTRAGQNALQRDQTCDLSKAVFTNYAKIGFYYDGSRDRMVETNHNVYMTFTRMKDDMQGSLVVFPRVTYIEQVPRGSKHYVYFRATSEYTEQHVYESETLAISTVVGSLGGLISLGWAMIAAASKVLDHFCRHRYSNDHPSKQSSESDSLSQSAVVLGSASGYGTVSLLVDNSAGAT